MFVVVYMVLFGATVFVLRTLWRHGLCGGGARSAQDSDDAPKVWICILGKFLVMFGQLILWIGCVSRKEGPAGGLLPVFWPSVFSILVQL